MFSTLPNQQPETRWMYIISVGEVLKLYALPLFFQPKKTLRKLGGDAWRLRVVAGALWVPNLVRCLRGVVLVSRSKNRGLKKKNAAVFTMWCVVIFFSGKKTTASGCLVKVVFVLNQVCCIWEMQTVGMKSSTAGFSMWFFTFSYI